MTLPTKVTKEALTNKIADVAYVLLPDGRTTMCQLTMLNGFTVLGASSCVSVENFNKALGEEYSYEGALDDAWKFEGYLLAEDRHREARGDINTLESLQQDARLKMAHELMEILGFDDPTQIVARVRMLNECLIAHESRPKPANMIMLRLGDGCWVASDTIGEVKVNALANVMTVRTKDGIGHSVDPDYGRSIYTTAARLIDEINAANESSTRKDGDPVLQVVADSDAV